MTSGMTCGQGLAVVAIAILTVAAHFLEEYATEEVYVLLGFAAFAAYISHTKTQVKKSPEDDGDGENVQNNLAEQNASRTRQTLPSQNAYNIRIRDFMKDGDAAAAEKVIVEMRVAKVTPDLVTYNSFVQGYAKLGNLRSAEAYVDCIEKASLEPDSYTFVPMVLGYVRRAGDNPEKYGDNLDLAERWIIRMRDAGVKAHAALYNSVLDLFSRSEQPSKVDAWLFEMVEEGPAPNTESFNAGIGAWGRSGRTDRMEAWYKRMKTAKVPPDYHTFDKLIMGFGKSGNIEKAEQILDKMADEGVPPHCNCYSSLLRVYGVHGKIDRMEALFQRMLQRGAKPSLQTYSAIVKAYSRALLPDKVREIFVQMNQDSIHPFKEPNFLSMGLMSFGNEPWRYANKAKEVQSAMAMLEEAATSGGDIVKEDLIIFERLVGCLEAEKMVKRLKLEKLGWAPKRTRLSRQVAP